MKTSQFDWVKKTLIKKGEISRNLCLRRYISRLSSIIFELKREGYQIIGGYKKTRNGRDYIYKLIK